MSRIGAVLLAATLPCGAGDPIRLRVDFGEVVGTIRPLHGVNGGPLCRGETVDLTAHWRDAGIPLARLHDVEWPRPDLVDMHAVFPDPAADPSDPASYSFEKTDDHLGAVVASGAGVVYRLGESIEHTRTKHHVHPPADPDRWAAACVGVVKHYNEGWANGTRYGIEYWEVWNEPENRPACWTGTDEEYYRLYAATARALKGAFPQLKVGGPAAGSVGEVVDGELVPTPFAAEFVAYLRREKLPLDFFSWHHYSDDPAEFAIRAGAIRRWLDREGFRETESHLNEWNYLPGGDWSPVMPAGQGEKRRRWNERMQGTEGAAFAACVLCDLQGAPVDAANFFRGDAGAFGLFDEHGTPTKVFHAFRAFRMTLETPRRVKAEGAEPGRTAVLAGMSDDRASATLLLANYAEGNERFEIALERMPWDGETEYETRTLNGSRDPESDGMRVLVDGTLVVEAAAPGVALVMLRRAEP